jgi:CysZ protein
MRRSGPRLFGVNASGFTGTAVGAGRRFAGGAGLLLRGIGLYVRNPGLMLLGVVPALISGAVFVTAYAILVLFVGELAAAATPFADDWAAAPRSVVRVIAALAFLGLGGLLTVLTFTAVTLVIGDPFYEKISERVEQRYGGTPDAVEVPFWPSLRRSATDSLRLVALAATFGVPLFAAGFIPLLGQTVVPVIGAAVGGWLLAVELVGAAFSRRGKRLPDRRAALTADRPTALGFGVAVFVCFLIPLGAVLLMPAAVAGATLLARRSLGQPITED